MPHPRHKRKSKASTNAKTTKCLTLEGDEITRCGQIATEGHPNPERCKVHQGQYYVLYKKYKDASKVVDDIKGGAELPTKEQIGRYTDWHAALEKARWVCTYLEAIRVEKTGRDIHLKRFFLKVDDGHKRRLKLLEREMARAVDVLDTLQKRTYELYQHNGILHATNNQALSTAEVHMKKLSKRTTEEVLESIYNPDAYHDSTLPIPRKKAPTLLHTPAVGDKDLIDMTLLAQKEYMLMILKPLNGFESFL